MVKLARGPRRPSGPGRQEPVPLFPPGDLPVFGPPPANLRRPMPPPRGLGHMPGGFAPPMARPHIPPPPPPPPPHHMRPPMHHHLAPPPFPPVHRRPGPPPPPPPLRPLLQTPVLPPRPLPFMRGGGRGPVHMGRGPAGPVKRLGKNMKKSKNKKNKSKDNQKSDGEHYCDVCDRGWDTPEELSEHLESHTTCGIDDCAFTAHPKVVAIHVKFQHTTGLYKKIVRTYDKDEINKWIAERKRKYPTQENIVHKQAMQSEMEERGERIHEETKKFRSINSDKRRTWNKKRNFKDKRIIKWPEEINYLPLCDDSSMNGVPAFRGIDSYNIGTDDDNDKKCSNAEDEFSDDEWKASSSGKTEKPLCSALFALRSLYGSDASQSEGEICDEDVKTNTQNRNNVKRSTGNSEYTGDNTECTENIADAPEEIMGNKTEDTAPNFYVNSNKNGLANNLRKPKYNKGKNKTHPPAASENTANSAAYRNKYFNLLEKLLRNEIKHERNYILQCIRYIVNNNFLKD